MASTINVTLPEAIRRIANAPDRQLAWQFFIFFSRFEYALKRVSRFLKNGSGNAEPDWDKFATFYNDDFKSLDSIELQIAIDYYCKCSPRKQLRDNGMMSWSEPQTWNNDGPFLKWLLIVVRSVRNNLFHGGKFPLIPIADPSRDRDLLVHAISILSACLELDSQVEQKFYEDINN